MRILLLALYSVSIIHAASLNKKEKCDGVKINGVYHDKELLKTGLEKPYNFAIDFDENILYFSYTDRDPVDIFKAAELNLITRELSDIRGVEDGFTLAVDQKNNEVYIGTDKGIYKYDSKFEQAQPFAVKDSNIWKIFYDNNVLYYIEFPSQFVYALEDGHAVRIKDLEDTKPLHFVIDKDNDMIYGNTTALYSQKRGAKNVVSYNIDVSKGYIRNIITDANGNAYVSIRDGVYKLNKSTMGLDKVLDTENANGVAFDVNNNIVYAEGDSIVRVKANKNKNC